MTPRSLVSLTAMAATEIQGPSLEAPSPFKEASERRTEIVLSLVSHTNIGKTTLARTLLGEDVGEVADREHVTETASRREMIHTHKAALILWDTPGFGHIGKLLKRLRRENGAAGWIMNEVVDRFFNRSLYCSLEAARNVRSEADLVLYLVNVREEPEDAAYVNAELELLQALEKPVIMILNQVDWDRDPTPLRMKELENRWKQSFSRYPCLCNVLVLDAFTRAWHQELRLMDLIEPHLTPDKQTALAMIRNQWVRQYEQIKTSAIEQAGRLFLFACRQHTKQRPDQGKAETFHALLAELQNQMDAYLDHLIALFHIESSGQARLQADIQQLAGLAGKALSETRSGLLAGALSGAGTGLAADLMSGGLTVGGGALLGFLGGYLGGASYASVMNRLPRGRVSWKKPALIQFFKLTITYYLVTSHHGRGKGPLKAEEPNQYLTILVERHTRDLERDIGTLCKMAASPEHDEEAIKSFHKQFETLFGKVLTRVLATLFPRGIQS
ncbi:DUF3482 domain-containing protein [Sulfidibacter corallicola]|uniref:DUF3482 domain-containing protein n=1 Tax=Sulfidibacter corallicola TaxID=2818388 RepID=A0A8A4TF99_SULCO|nr:DUF3482 domain-containing protein [Sulfidibacter corallicola]QTD47884.1 DUF3482 domain-containing protein [Sulfidibacter corallicola]